MKSVRASTKKKLNSVGIDISDGSLELCYITRDDKSNISFRSLARIELEDSVIVHGRIRKQKELSLALKNLYVQAQLNPNEFSVVAALPDSQVIIKSISVSHNKTPPLEYLDSLADSVVTHLTSSIKQPLAKWIYYPHTNRSGRLLVFVTERSYVAQWKRFFKKHSVPLQILEMESLALIRSLLPKISKRDKIALLDFGHRATNLSIVDSSGLIYSHALDIGGLDITTMLSRQLHISEEEAREIKITSGLKKRVKNDVSSLIQGKIKQIIRDLSLDDLMHEYGVTELVLCGGGSNMPELVPFIKKTLTKPVTLGTIALRHSNRNIKIVDPKITSDENRLYAGSIGLAMRGSEIENRPRELNFLS